MDVLQTNAFFNFCIDQVRKQESGELKEQIVQLTKKINFNLDDLYVMDASKRNMMVSWISGLRF